MCMERLLGGNKKIRMFFQSVTLKSNQTVLSKHKNDPIYFMEVALW